MEERERLELIQGMVDRLLYLQDNDRKEFLNYLDALYCVFPVPKKVLHGEAAIKAMREQQECNKT